ncbi:MAG: hypothetical protein R3C39_01770 [Dehalococcoidia bacterium]
MVSERAQRLAIDCMWLRRTIDSSQANNPFQTLCSHIIRDGKDCVGPFLDAMETDCKLWEPNARLAARLAETGRSV